MQTTSRSNTVATGFAMFSMFFGAGNVVFPLALGQHAQSMNFYAVLGLVVTAVGVTLTGLIAMTLFNGNYKHFFERVGVVPGFVISAIIMCLIGPFGGMPRCIALSYSTVKMYIPEVSLEYFSILSCLVIFFLTIRHNRILDMLGYVLTPLLLGSLAIIIVRGFLVSPPAPLADHSAFATFAMGLKEGYQTMDLLSAFFFSSVIISCLRENIDPEHHSNYKKLVVMTIKASAIGAALLTLVYIGFSYVAAFNSEILSDVPKDELIGVLALHILGKYAGVVAIAAVALACLTTAIALASAFAEFLHIDVFQDRISYASSLAITLVVTFFVSTLNFTGIAQVLTPILHVCYPALIVLSIVNILYKLYQFKPVKVPVAIAFVLSVASIFI